MPDPTLDHPHPHPDAAQLPAVLTPTQLAELMSVPVKTVYRWNVQGTGPEPGRYGKHVRYRREDVLTWLAQHVGASA